MGLCEQRLLARKKQENTYPLATTASAIARLAAIQVCRAGLPLSDRMVGLVERMLEMVPKRRVEQNPQVAAQLDAQIAATAPQIDRLIYDLYGLTKKEIALLEGA